MVPAPLILELKGNSLDDGPGIRTVVFFKGCPLDCVWCHNPESKKRRVEIAFDARLCVGCGTCMQICPSDALSPENPMFINRRLCDLCFDCADNCPSGALERIGLAMEIPELVDRVIKDKPFFDTSNGGATLSGGEPTLYPTYLAQAAKGLKEKGVHVLVETCGLFKYDTFMSHVYPHVDLIYFDIKIIDGQHHKKHCGRSNKLILDNFKKLYKNFMEGGVEILPRTPLVPGITDTKENLSAIMSLYKQEGVKRTQLLPYHPMWQEKNKKIGICPPSNNGGGMAEWMPRERVEACEKIFRENGILVES